MRAKSVHKIVISSLVVVLFTGLQMPAHLAAHGDPLAPGIPRDLIRFGNVSFDPGTQWIVIGQGQTMLMVPNNPMFKDTVRLNVGPVSTGNAAALIAQIWATLSAGKQIQGHVTDDSSMLMGGGGRLYRHFAMFQDGSGAYIVLVEVSGKLTPFVLIGDNKNAAEAAWTFFIQVLMTLKAEVDSGSTPAGSTSGRFDIGAPSDQGPDPYDSIDWDGPDEFTHGIYDIHPIHPKNELEKAVLLNGSFIGSVQAREVSFGDALAHIRSLLNNPKTKSEYEDLKRQMSGKDPILLKGTAFAQVISGEPLSALLNLFAAYEFNPNDPDCLIDLAAMLAHCGMPNESLAILKEMERRSMKPKPASVNPDALIEYLKGFNQLLIGQTSTGKFHLHQAINLDPFLKEASLALALAQKLTGESEEAEKTYYQGVWRRRPTQYLLCGGTGGGDPNNPYVRPPITDMLDVPHGKAGTLPQFDHPGNFAQALGLTDRYQKALMQTKDEAQGYAKRSVDIAQRLSKRPQTADEVYADYVDFLVSTLQVEEPPVIKLLAAKDKADKEAADAVVRISQQKIKIVMAIMMTPGDHTREFQQIANDAVSALRPFAQAYDRAVRRLHRTWYRYATGLAVHLGDPDWHEKEDLKIRVHTDEEWVSLLVPMMGWYTAVAGASGASLRDPSGDVSNPNHLAMDQCPPGIRDTGIKLGFSMEIPPLEKVSFSMKFTCDKKSFEVGYNPLDIDSGFLQESVGVFGALEFARKGDMTLAVGVKGSFGVLHAGDAISGQGAIYVTADAKGNLKDGGFKGNAEAVGQKVGEVNLNAANLAIDFIPSFAGASRGPNLRQ